MKRVIFAVCALVMLRSPPARAQGSANDVRADSLFRAAKQLQDAGQIADACPMFAESKRLGPGVGVTLHLADCYERLGRNASAWNQFREAEGLARAQGDEKRANLARTRAQALESKLDRLTIVESAKHPEWQVLVDGAPLPANRMNASLAVDPGEHEVVVQAPGQPSRTLHAHLGAAGDATTVPVDELRVAAAGGVAGAGVAGASGAASAPLSTVGPSGGAAAGGGSGGGGTARTWIEISFLGAAALGAGFGTWFWVRHDQLNNSGNPCDPPLVTDASIGEAISFGVAGAALGTAAILYLTRPGPRVETGRARSSPFALVAPSVWPGGGGALLRAAF